MSRLSFFQLRRFSIRRQVILLFFLVIVLPFLFIGYFAYSKSVKAIQNVSSIVSEEMMSKNAKNLENYLDLVDSAQNDIMYSPEMQNLLTIVPKNTLEELEIANQLIQYTNILSMNSHAYSIRIFPIEPSRYPTFTQAIYQGIDVEKEPWFRDAKEMKSPFWQLFLPTTNNAMFKEPILSKIKQLYSLDKSEPIGFVAADIKVSTLRDYLAPVKMVAQQQVMLLDEKDVIAYHQDQALIGTRVAPKELREFLHTTPESDRPVEIDGTKYIVTYASLTNGWRVVSLLPVSVLTKPVSGIEHISILFLLFYLTLSVLTVAYLTSHFTNPIQKLVQAMRKAERGEFLSGLPKVRRMDEIGWLYRGFDNLVKRIDQLVQNAEKEAKDKKELEFQVLTHQINPHFLYNTLEAIRWKAESRGAGDISEMVRSLGNLLRLSLNDGREMSTVAREIEHVKAYVNIQTARQNVSIRVVYLVDEEMMAMPCLRLLFQPLVENAIKHGTRHAVDGDAVKIIIKGSLEPSLLRFVIIDNGPGIPQEARTTLLTSADTVTNERKGVGLRNVHERLKIYFGEQYGLRILDPEDSGTVIELTHPILSPDGDDGED
jgi:sensor histidine kinase YesM